MHTMGLKHFSKLLPNNSKHFKTGNWQTVFTFFRLTNNTSTFRELQPNNTNTFLEFTSSNTDTFTYLMSNSTDFFRVHINNTDTFRELLLSNTDFIVHVKQYWHFQRLTVKQYKLCSIHITAKQYWHIFRGHIKQYWNFHGVAA